MTGSLSCLNQLQTGGCCLSEVRRREQEGQSAETPYFRRGTPRAHPPPQRVVGPKGTLRSQRLHVKQALTCLDALSSHYWGGSRIAHRQAARTDALRPGAAICMVKMRFPKEQRVIVLAALTHPFPPYSGVRQGNFSFPGWMVSTCWLHSIPWKKTA